MCAIWGFRRLKVCRVIFWFWLCAVFVAAPAGVNAETRTYVYELDPAGRLTGIQDDTHHASYRYDAMGNLLQRTVSVPEPGLLGQWASLLALAVFSRFRRRRAQHRSRFARRLFGIALAGTLFAALLAPNPARAHTVIYIAGDISIPTFLLTDLSLQTERVATNGVFASAAFAAVDESCTATVAISQTNGPVGFVVVNPAPPATPVLRYDFSLDVIQIPTSTIQVTFTLVWTGSGGPGEFCGTGTEMSVLSFQVEPPSDSSGNLASSATTADPINTFNLELTHTLPPLIHLGGAMSLYLDLYYASFIEADGSATTTVGQNWLHNFEYALEVIGNTIRVVTDEARVVNFLWDGGDVYELQNVPDIPFQMANDGADRVMIDPRRNQIFRFDTSGKLIAIEDRVGNTHTLSYTANQLMQVADGDGRTLTFTYNGALLATVGDGTRTVSFTQTGGNLTSITDARGNSMNFTYETVHSVPGLMASSIKPAGNGLMTQTYDVDGQAVTQSDAGPDTYSLALAPPDTTITDPTGNAEVHTYNDRGQLVSWTDAAGNDSSYTYNQSDQRITITDRLGNTVTFDYHAPSGQISMELAANGDTTTYTFFEQTVDGLKLYTMTSATYPDLSTESFTRDQATGNLTTFTNGAGETYDYAHDASGQLTQITFPDGGTATYTYNADATLASQTDHTGNVVTFGYDGLRRLTTVGHEDGATQTFVWDGNDNIVSFTNPRNGTSTATYDENDRMTQMTNPVGSVTTYTFDSQDRLATRTNPVGGVNSFTYDEEDRLQTGTDSNGNLTRYAYDGRGRLVSITDAAGNVFSFAWDLEGILTGMTDPLGNGSVLTTDSRARITKLTTPEGFEWNISYDSMSQITDITDPLGQATRYAYDVLGSLTDITLEDGTMVDFARNVRRQITALTDPNGNIWNQSYDLQGRSAGRSDPLGNSWSYSYDNRNRVSQVGLPLAASSLDVSYDLNGMPTRRLYTDGTDLNFSFDVANKLVSADGLNFVHDANDRLIESNGIELSRGPGGRIETIELTPSEVPTRAITYAYNSRNLVESVTDWLGGQTSFNYDAARRVTSIARTNGVTTTFTYDDDSRIVGITEGAIASTLLTRDGAGQVIAATRTVPSAPKVADIANLVASYDDAAQIDGLSYDAMGRLTDDGNRTYTWDLANRLTRYTEASNDTDAVYNALGHRIERTRGATVTSYVLNYGHGLPVANIEREGVTDVRYYITAPNGTLLYSIDASTDARLDYHFDEMGNTIFLTDSGGIVVASYAYDPYGRLLESTGAVENPLTWQGRMGVRDEGNGLYYMLVRFYDSRSGRFISRDPIHLAEPKAVNPYQYAMSNPMLYIDPAGLIAVSAPSPIGSLGAEPRSGDPGLAPMQFGFFFFDVGALARLFGNMKVHEYLTFARILDDHANAILRGTAMQFIPRMLARITGQVKPVPGPNWSAAVRYHKFFSEGARSHTGEIISVADKLDDLERAAQTGSKFRTAGNALAAIGITLDAGLTIYDGVCHGDGAGRVTLDTTATVGADLAVMAAANSNPVVAIGDLVTGGGISGGATNAVVAGEVLCEMAFGDSWTPADAARTKRRMTRKWATRQAWNAGEYYEEKFGLSDHLVWLFLD